MYNAYAVLRWLEISLENVETIFQIFITKLDETKLAKLRRTEMGFVFQFFNLSPYLTLKENIFLPITLFMSYKEK